MFRRKTMVWESDLCFESHLYLIFSMKLEAICFFPILSFSVCQMKISPATWPFHASHFLICITEWILAPATYVGLLWGVNEIIYTKANLKRIYRWPQEPTWVRHPSIFVVKYHALYDLKKDHFLIYKIAELNRMAVRWHVNITQQRKQCIQTFCLACANK